MVVILFKVLDEDDVPEHLPSHAENKKRLHVEFKEHFGFISDDKEWEIKKKPKREKKGKKLVRPKKHTKEISELEFNGVNGDDDKTTTTTPSGVEAVIPDDKHTKVIPVKVKIEKLDRKKRTPKAKKTKTDLEKFTHAETTCIVC